ncbi:unnamed protein product [Cunninghamella echinulata]
MARKRKNNNYNKEVLNFNEYTFENQNNSISSTTWVNPVLTYISGINSILCDIYDDHHNKIFLSVFI